MHGRASKDWIGITDVGIAPPREANLEEHAIAQPSPMGVFRPEQKLFRVFPPLPVASGTVTGASNVASGRRRPDV